MAGGQLPTSDVDRDERQHRRTPLQVTPSPSQAGTMALTIKYSYKADTVFKGPQTENHY